MTLNGFVSQVEETQPSPTQLSVSSGDSTTCDVEPTTQSAREKAAEAKSRAKEAKVAEAQAVKEAAKKREGPWTKVEVCVCVCVYVCVCVGVWCVCCVYV